MENYGRTLTAAFRKVRTKPPEKDRIPTSSAAPELARNFLLETYSKYKNPRLAVVSEKAAKRQILEVAKHTKALLSALEQMSGPAERAFPLLNSAFFSTLTTQLRLLDVASNWADAPELPPNAGKGRPKNIYAQRVADVAARYYWFLSGEPPTATKPNGKDEAAYSEYLFLLEEIFVILGLKDSLVGQKANKPATYATEAVKGWIKMRPQAERQFGWVDPNKEKKQP